MQIVVGFRPGFVPFTCIMFCSMLFTHPWCVFYDTPMRLPVLLRRYAGYPVKYELLKKEMVTCGSSVQ